MNTQTSRFLMGGMLALAATTFLSAEIPSTIHYQGKVAVDGVPVSGQYDFKFAIVDGGTENVATAEAEAIVRGSQVADINITAMGQGYLDEDPPQVTIGGMGEGASAEATVTNGQVTAINIIDGGFGYDDTFTFVLIADPPPSNIETLWSNDGTSSAGAMPTTSVSLSVQNGLFSVPLGDAGEFGMESLPQAEDWVQPAFLRVWFDDGGGFQQLTPDQPLQSVPFALRSQQADSLTEGALGGALLSGGQNNVASGTNAFVSGGTNFTPNEATGNRSSVIGGQSNTASGLNSAVVGGSDNLAQGSRSFAAGQRAKALHNNTFVWSDSSFGDFESTASDQFLIRASGGVGIGTNDPQADLQIVGRFISGDANNAAGASRTFVGGGASNLATAFNAAVIGGQENEATGNHSFVGGGTENTATAINTLSAGGQGNQAMSTRAAVVGGRNNTASASNAVVGGGENNVADGQNAFVGGGSGSAAEGTGAFVAGGGNNHAEDSRTFIGGGFGNTASGFAGVVLGGTDNEASGMRSFAAGRRAKANHHGSFVWADGSDEDFSSTGENQFLIRAGGGVGIGTNGTNNQLSVSGRADFSERVGIGTGSPARMLHLKGDFANTPTMLFQSDDAPANQQTSALFMNVSTGHMSLGRMNDAGTALEETQMQIRADNGYVGIGTTNPQAMMHIGGLSTNSNTRDGVRLENTDHNTWDIHTSSNLLIFNYNGFKSAQLHPELGWTTFSDARLKTGISTADPVLSPLRELEVVSYQFRGREPLEHPQVGFLAQNVNEVFPHLAHRDGEDGYWGVNYAGFSVVAIQAIQEQQDIIEAKAERIAELEAQQRKTEERLVRLEAAILPESDSETTVAANP